MKNEKLYEYVLIKEIEEGNLNKGFWAKSLSKAVWDSSKAKVIYLESRVDYLKELLDKKNIDYDQLDLTKLSAIIESSLLNPKRNHTQETIIKENTAVESNVLVSKDDTNEIETQDFDIKQAPIKENVEVESPVQVSKDKINEVEIQNTDIEQTIVKDLDINQEKKEDKRKKKSYLKKKLRILKKKRERKKRLKKKNRKKRFKRSSFSTYYLNDNERIGQKEFLFRTFFTFLNFMSILFLLTYLNKIYIQNTHIYGMIIVAFLIVVNFTIHPTIKRLQDANLNRWFTLLMFIPLVNILFLLILVMIPSYKKKNEYGSMSEKYKLDLYCYVVLFIELIIIFSIMFFIMLNSGYFKSHKNIEKSFNSMIINKKPKEKVTVKEVLDEITVEKKNPKEKETVKEILDEATVKKQEPIEKETVEETFDETFIEDTNSQEIVGLEITQKILKKYEKLEENLIEDERLPEDVNIEEKVESEKIQKGEGAQDINSKENTALNTTEKTLQKNTSLEENLIEKKTILKDKKQEEIVVKDRVEEKTPPKKIKKYQLYLITIPYKSTITFVDKKLTYKENMKLAPGKYKIKVEKKGYIPEYKTINVNKDLFVEIFLKRVSNKK